jgi:hypothetical protein
MGLLHHKAVQLLGWLVWLAQLLLQHSLQALLQGPQMLTVMLH